MTTDTLSKANHLQQKITELDSFIRAITDNRLLRVFNKPIKKAEKMTLCATDYMRPYAYYEVSQDTRQRILQILEEERESLQNKFDALK